MEKTSKPENFAIRFIAKKPFDGFQVYPSFNELFRRLLVLNCADIMYTEFTINYLDLFATFVGSKVGQTEVKEVNESDDDRITAVSSGVGPTIY